MKGLKCSRFLFCLSAIFSVLVCSLLTSSTVSAAGIYTNAFRIQGYNNVTHDVEQLYPIYYGPNNSFSVGTPVSGATWNWVSEYDWITPFIDIEGNTAAFHWETNIVAQSTNTSFQNPFNNLDSLYVSRCGSRTVNQQSVSYAITPWSEGNYKKYTLTIYADASLTGFNKGTQDDVRCAIASYDDSFMDTETSAIGGYQVYFEKNIINYVFSDSIDNSLLQTMIGQNTTLIQQNQETRETIDRNGQEIVDAIGQIDQDNADATSDAQSDAQDDVDGAQDDVDSASSTLIQQVSTLVTGLRQVQPSNCVIAFDLFSTSAYGRGSSAQAYNIDLCALSRPASFQVIDQILKVVWIVGAILMVLNAMLGLFREVQGGGE